jgi:hypothetical protein
MRITRSLLAFVLLAMPATVAAQGLTYGVTAGVNFATLNFDPEQDGDFGYRIGLAAGGFVSLPLGSRLSIQPEGLFSQKGSKADLDGVDAEMQLDYLEVPILVKYALSSNASGAFYVFGGPSMAFKLRSKATASFGDVTVDTGEDDRIKDSDFGVVVGAGKNFGRMSIDGRYTFGLSNINGDDPDLQKIRNRSISVLASVRF